MMHIVTFGTSLTARGGWQNALAISLERCIGKPVRVTNLAKNGASSDWGFANTDKVIASKPDVVLIEFSINDAALNRVLTPRASAANVRSIVRADSTGIASDKDFPNDNEPCYRIEALA